MEPKKYRLASGWEAEGSWSVWGYSAKGVLLRRSIWDTWSPGLWSLLFRFKSPGKDFTASQPADKPRNPN